MVATHSPQSPGPIGQRISASDALRCWTGDMPNLLVYFFAFTGPRAALGGLASGLALDLAAPCCDARAPARAGKRKHYDRSHGGHEDGPDVEPRDPGPAQQSHEEAPN